MFVLLTIHPILAVPARPCCAWLFHESNKPSHAVYRSAFFAFRPLFHPIRQIRPCPSVSFSRLSPTKARSPFARVATNGKPGSREPRGMKRLLERGSETRCLHRDPNTRPEILEIAVYFPSEGIELATLRVTPRPHPIIFLDGEIEMRHRIRRRSTTISFEATARSPDLLFVLVSLFP